MDSISELFGGAQRGRTRPHGFAPWSPQPETLELLARVNAVLREYADHLPLTLRQIFYRLVGPHGYEKTERAYQRLSEHLVPQMSADYIDACCREIARVLVPSGYCMRWTDTFGLGEAHHLRIADVLKCVDLIAWDNQRQGQGHRTRRRGMYLLVLQKPPLYAKATWGDHRIPDRWAEGIPHPKSQHPHTKPIGLISRLIGAVTKPGDLVVDPAAGGFVVLRAAMTLGRKFIGCDIAHHREDQIAAL
jgi:site-specific DNA-methyltransferase (adenine-specific)